MDRLAIYSFISLCTLVYGSHIFMNHWPRASLSVFECWRGAVHTLIPFFLCVEIFVRSSGQWIPNSGGSGRLEDRVSELEEAARQAHQRLGTAVLATGPATWPGASRRLPEVYVLRLERKKRMK